MDNEQFLQEFEEAWRKGFMAGYDAALTHAISQVESLRVEAPHGEPE